MSERVRTRSIPACEHHPPYNQWPTQNLIVGMCPACYSACLGDCAAQVRELRARRLIEQREQS